LSVRVGIPRGLLYYYYSDLWQDFFTRLGAQVVISGETCRTAVEYGNIIDEVCLPVKAFVGHIHELAAKADFIFIPRVVSVNSEQYTCPKIIGLPDIIRSVMPELPQLADFTVDVWHKRWSVLQAVVKAGQLVGRGPFASFRAWQHSLRQMPQSRFQQSGMKRLKVAVIGHPYLIYDQYLSMGVIRKLSQLGADVVTAESVDARQRELAARRLHKKLFWSYCHGLAGAALAMMYSPQLLDGLVFVTSFSCGPDSLTVELLKRHADHLELPFLLVTLDEHSAEAGVVTRLEAFYDMLQRRGDK
jgi:predicted nucleotide-binding protein (sugar kinase/HSP70/actin superfamily)